MLETFTLSTFKPHVGKKFSIRLDEMKQVELHLVEANALGGDRATGDRRVPFSLVFQGPKDFLLPQRIYPFEHEALGAFEIFIVPIGVDEKGLRYEAVFT
jgi:hypothetical protein